MDKTDKERMIVVAQFAGTHGVRGDFKIRSFTEEPGRLFSYGPLRTESGLTLSPKKIRELKPGVFLCRDKGLTSPEAAEPFKAQLLYVCRDILPDTGDDDDFYVEDLIGLEVRLEDGTVIGQVRAVPNYGAGDILEIKGTDGPILVPFTKDAVPAVSLADGIVTVAPLPEDETDGD